MIVMNTFGRSQFSEYLLGRATLRVLKQMTLPILKKR